MNIHPAFVHFPIALLTLYALIELLPLAYLNLSVDWNQIKRFLLYVGSLGAAATAVTGFMAAEMYGETPAVEMHEHAALILVATFVVASLIDFFWKGEHAAKPWVMKLLALFGLAMLFIVGALGANLVYGPNVDPIVTFVVWLVGL